MAVSKLTDRAMLKYVFLTAACAAAGYLSGAFAAHFPGDSSAWASWVQAIGSIAAIIGAYMIGERQSQATLASVRESHRLTEESKRGSRFAVLHAAHNRANLIWNAMGKPEPSLALMEVYHSSIIDSLVLAMNNIQASDLGSDEAVDAFIIFSGQFVFLREAMEKFMAGPYRNPDVQKSLQKLKDHGYGDKEQDAVIETARGVSRRNVEVHIERINDEFQRLKKHLGPH